MKGIIRFLHWPRGSIAWVGGLALLGLSAGPVAANLLNPTPLILKDGRIASVSVHTLPFAANSSTLDPGAGRELQALTVAMATDCFLTAQVIGHVGSAEVEDNDTLGAHRLARSRADEVQASLIDAGLPAKSIASVWDWQFMVLEARATLWVFRLTEGEDCEGQVLEGASGLLAAAGPRGGAASATETTTRQAAARSPARGTAPAAQPSARTTAPPPAAGSSATSALAAASGAPARERSTAAAPASPEPTRSSPVTRPAAAAEPAPRTNDRAGETPDGGPTAVTRALPASTAASSARSAPAASSAAPVKQVARATPEPGAGGTSLAITFATNSSYFPAGTRNRLAAMVRDMEPGRTYEVELFASVSSASSVVGASSPEEAARYNKWLADRRLDRVKDWFAVNAKDKDVVIRPDYRRDDDSREVVVRIAPAETS